MNGAALKARMKQDGYIYGTHIVGLESPVVARWIAECGMDFVFICQEHIPLTREQASMMCQLFSSYGISPMVRIPYPDSRLATIAVEGGAEGIVVPYVEELSQIEPIINALKYRPIKGKYLEDIVSGRAAAPKKLTDYMAKLNKDLYLVAGIESVPAIDNLDSFLDCEDVYAIFLGPHDISCSMGLPCDYEHPDFVALICDVIRRCRKKGKPVGVHADYGAEKNRPFLEAGANFILDNSDVTKAIPSLKEDFEFVRNTYEK